ncbi:MAG: 50S ribosomal protein L23 [Candidatus Sericytochromatia bacterium]|nr:50S ribosomal protein L23 [Candidatus Sericytochromatia bacterium]
MHNDPYQIVKRLVITEKNMDMNPLNKYVFEVDIRANKVEIGKAVAKLFSVDILSVNTLRAKAEHKKFGSRSVKKKASKKAIITVAAGQSINLLD